MSTNRRTIQNQNKRVISICFDKILQNQNRRGTYRAKTFSHRILLADPDLVYILEYSLSTSFEPKNLKEIWSDTAKSYGKHMF